MRKRYCLPYTQISSHLYLFNLQCLTTNHYFYIERTNKESCFTEDY